MRSLPVVLLADREDLARLEGKLVAQGFEVRICQRASEVLAVVTPDVLAVLCDLATSPLAVLGIADAIRARPDLTRVSVIAYGTPGTSARERALIDAWAPLEATASELRHVIELAVRARRRSTGALPRVPRRSVRPPPG